ncbi:MAG: plasmid pRiA4b ORF-3 family protein [Deferribacteraceae bacterium]|nr:plasmid pRiA4b ORF-3 family protein [Deferribacteraceae bacterium]
MATQPIYQIYAELMDYEPKIWRRFQVANNVTMSKLAYIIMSMFEMQARHLFRFDIEDTYEILNKREVISKSYELFDDPEDPYFTQSKRTQIDVTKAKIKNVMDTPNGIHTKQSIDFCYDFGDNWHIQLILEEIIIDKGLDAKELPRVLAGEGYGIIEDCGSTYGLAEIAQAFKLKKGEKYREFSGWLGRKELNLESFDLEDASLRVKKIPRIYKDAYENDLPPTKQSIDFLERKYKK